MDDIKEELSKVSFRLSINRKTETTTLLATDITESLAIIFTDMLGRSSLSNLSQVVTNYNNASGREASADPSAHASKLALEERFVPVEPISEFFRALGGYLITQAKADSLPFLKTYMLRQSFYKACLNLKVKAEAKDPNLLNLLNDHGFRPSRGTGYATLAINFIVKEMDMDVKTQRKILTQAFALAASSNVMADLWSDGILVLIRSGTLYR